MNVATLKTVSYLSSFGLLGGIGYVGYDYYENGQKQKYFDNEETIGLLRSVEPPAARKRSGLDYKGDVTPAFLDVNWTGKPPEIVAPPKPPGPEKGPAKVIPVSEILDVVAILHDSEKESGSRCLLSIEGTVQSYDDLFFGVGDSLPAPHDGVSVFAIEPDIVEFSFADEERDRETIRPATRRDGKKALIVSTDPGSVREPNKLRFDPNTSTSSSTASGRTEKRNGIYHIGQEDAQIFADDYQRIMSEDVSVETYYKDGKRAGLKIKSVKPGSIAASHGVQEDDIIISINGDSVTSEQEGIQYVNRNSETTSTWRVKFIRFGIEREEVYRSPE